VSGAHLGIQVGQLARRSVLRTMRQPAQIVQLRYDSRANLAARGVIRETAPCGRPCPQPFPGFAPDPAGPLSYFSP